MSKALAILSPLIALLPITGFAAEQSASMQKATKKTTSVKSKKAFTAFTGKIIGNKVRMRVKPDLESHIVKELDKNDLVVVTKEKGDFYAVQPPQDIKVYIFRTFVLDNMVEGDHVNVRLAPSKEAPVIGHLSTGAPISGIISKKHPKWMEITIPESAKFFIAKEYIKYAGNPELKAIQDKRRHSVTQLLESTHLLTQSEMQKPFSEIAIDHITNNYQKIIEEYTDFPNHVEQAKESLAKAKENYLHQKIAYLEKRSSVGSQTGNKRQMASVDDVFDSENAVSPTDRMKIWEPIEESLFMVWSAMHHAKTMDDYYTTQKLKGEMISGILEPFADPVKNKPGDFVLKDHDVPKAFVYSTHINLQNLVGKQVNLLVTIRPNNSFAFPAYYVLDAE